MPVNGDIIWKEEHDMSKVGDHDASAPKDDSALVADHPTEEVSDTGATVDGQDDADEAGDHNAGIVPVEHTMEPASSYNSSGEQYGDNVSDHDVGISDYNLSTGDEPTAEDYGMNLADTASDEDSDDRTGRSQSRSSEVEPDQSTRGSSPANVEDSDIRLFQSRFSQHQPSSGTPSVASPTVWILVSIKPAFTEHGFYQARLPTFPTLTVHIPSAIPTFTSPTAIPILDIEIPTTPARHSRPAIIPAVNGIPHDPFVTRDQLSTRVQDQLLQEFSAIPNNIVVQSRIQGMVNDLTRYAILSHRWGSNEVKYQDVCDVQDPRDYRNDQKIKGFLNQARKYDCRAELDESIRSMYTWYKTAYVCIVYLSKYTNEDPRDPWTSRGWTLQELLASRRISFFNTEWRRAFEAKHSILYPLRDFDFIRSLDQERMDYYTFKHGGNVGSFAETSHHSSDGLHDILRSPAMVWVASCTGVTVEISLEDLCVYNPSPNRARQIFTYMRERSTTVPEDIAYCLAGLLGVTLHIAYGEGADRALHRLQTACIAESDERNIFLWNSNTNYPSRFSSMLPIDPFQDLPSSYDIDPFISITAISLFGTTHRSVRPGQDSSQILADHTFAFTNGGLRISVILHDIIKEEEGKIYCAAAPYHGIEIDASHSSTKHALAILGTYKNNEGTEVPFPIILEKLDSGSIPRYRRIPCDIPNRESLPAELLFYYPQTVFIV
ncbi:hypothetical protein ONZ45_g8538 [Pleurotus djamor]|nr:hypothetical protein ONZ45_g8538 [Pleurotus djamor]